MWRGVSGCLPSQNQIDARQLQFEHEIIQCHFTLLRKISLRTPPPKFCPGSIVIRISHLLKKYRSQDVLGLLHFEWRTRPLKRLAVNVCLQCQHFQDQGHMCTQRNGCFSASPQLKAQCDIAKNAKKQVPRSQVTPMI